MRLIDADALKAYIEQFYRPLCDGYHIKDYALNQIISDIENQPTIGEWIPCSERLPSVGQDVLLSTKDWVAEGIRKANGTWFQFRWETPLKADEVLAWQPLPEPYDPNDTGQLSLF